MGRHRLICAVAVLLGTAASAAAGEQGAAALKAPPALPAPPANSPAAADPLPTVDAVATDSRPASSRNYPQWSFRIHPQCIERILSMRTVGLVPPRMSIHEVAAGGTRELKEDWSQAARDQVAAALAKGLEGRNLAMKFLEPGPETSEELEELRLLYEVVSANIVFATYRERFPAKMERFEYGVGDLARLLDSQGVDALLFVYGWSITPSAGRQATKAVTGASQIAAALLLGVVTVSSSATDSATMFDVALVDRSGAVVWFDMHWERGSNDLRDAQSIQGLVAQLLQHLPRRPP